jgi:hypothetical protein
VKPLIILAVGTSLFAAALIPTTLEEDPLEHTQRVNAAVTRAVSKPRSPGAAALQATLRCWRWRDTDVAVHSGGNCLSGVQNPLLRVLL